jgi:drug/metabolite transporter (DMT)-like permease
MGQQRTQATIAGCAAIVLWSTTVAFARSLSEQLGPLTAAAGVYSVSGLTALVSLLRDKKTRYRVQNFPTAYLFGCGTLFVTYMIFLFLALGLADSRQQVLEVGLLNYLWPILTLLLSVGLLGKKARWPLIPGTVFALVGIALVVTQGTHFSWRSVSRDFEGNPAPYLLGLAAALAWALYSTLTRRWAAGQSGGAVNVFLPATAVSLILLCCFAREPREWNPRSLTEIAFLGIATYLAYGLWDTAMRKGNIVLVATASYLTPLLSTIVSCFYLMVFPGPRLWLGCVLLVGGSLLSWSSIAQDSDAQDIPDRHKRQCRTG